MYKAEFINSKENYFVGDDWALKFIVRDENGDMVTSFGSIGIKCEVTNNGDETKLQNSVAGGDDTEIEVNSDSEIIVHVPNTDTVDYSTDFFTVELKIEISSKIYTVFSEKIYIKDETLDW